MPGTFYEIIMFFQKDITDCCIVNAFCLTLVNPQLIKIMVNNWIIPDSF